MSFEFFVARRYLKANRKGLFAFVTSAIGVAGVTIGVAALIATLSVMNGFQTDIQKKIIGAQSHLTVVGEMDARGLAAVKAALDKQPEVTAWAPFAMGQAILTSKGRSTGVAFKGMDIDREFLVDDLKSALTSGDWEKLRASGVLRPASGVVRLKDAKTQDAGHQTPDASLPIVLGEELAHNLGVWTGDSVVMVSPQGVQTPLGMFPRMQRFDVVGTLHTGYYEFDATFAYMSLEAAGRFMAAKEPAGGVAVRLKDLNAAAAVARNLQKELGFNFNVRTFAQMNQTLFAALKLEKAVMFLILALIVLVATFNIASNLIVLTTEKARDVGILRALGLPEIGARRIFWWVGALIGGVGVALGTGLGILVSWIIGRYPIVELPADIYYLSRVPVDIQPRDVITIAATALILCMLATVYPAWRASKVDPVEAIHYG